MLNRNHLLLLLLLPVASLNLVAQEVSVETKQVENTGTAAQEQASETEKKAQDNQPETPDTFEPSEEISEDLSVSFPVDI